MGQHSAGGETGAITFPPVDELIRSSCRRPAHGAAGGKLKGGRPSPRARFGLVLLNRVELAPDRELEAEADGRRPGRRRGRYKEEEEEEGGEVGERAWPLWMEASERVGGRMPGWVRRRP